MFPLLLIPTNPHHTLKQQHWPRLQPQTVSIRACNHPWCYMCKLHLNCSSSFRFNYLQNHTTYHVRRVFSCKTSNIIYCTKSRRNSTLDVATMQQFNVRIIHHRTNMHSKQPTYIHKNFRLLYHRSKSSNQSTHLTSPKTPSKISELWKATGSTYTLRTLTPYSLNNLLLPTRDIYTYVLCTGISLVGDGY